MTLEELQELLRKSWSRETTVDPLGWTPENPAWGQCAVTALVVQYFFGGEILGGKVKIKDIDYVNNRWDHFWNRLPDGREVDFTKEQFPIDTEITTSGQTFNKSLFIRIPDVRRRYALLRIAVEGQRGRKIKIFTVGNSKMGPEVLIFNLPPIETCRPSEWCRKNCYALKNRHRWFSVKESQQIKFELSKGPDFVELAMAELKRSKYRYVRLHSAGDFYSEEYARKWIEIIKRCPEKLFRTTTKRTDLGEVLQELDSLPNMIVRESLDPSRPGPSGLLPTLTVIEGTPVNRRLFFCRDDCVPCNYTCWKERVSMRVLPI